MHPNTYYIYQNQSIGREFTAALLLVRDIKFKVTLSFKKSDIMIKSDSFWYRINNL